MLVIMDGRRFFSLLLTFLVSLDVGDIMIIPKCLLSRLNYNSGDQTSDFRTFSCLLSSSNHNRIGGGSFVGAVDPGLATTLVGIQRDTYDSFNSKINNNKFLWDSFNRGEEDKLLFRLTDSSLSHKASVVSPNSNIENEEEGDDTFSAERGEEDSVEVSRTVEPQVLKRLESQFLKLFGMSKRPLKKDEKGIKVPKYLLDLYQKQNGADLPTSNLNLPGRHTRTANTVRTFYLETGSTPPVPTSSSREGDKNHLKFNLGSIPVSEQVTGAELRVPFEIQTNHDSDSSDGEVYLKSKLKSVRILIHDIVKPASMSNNKAKLRLAEPITHPIDSKSVDLSKRRNGTSTFWLTFDVFPAVNRWITQNHLDTGEGGSSSSESSKSKRKTGSNHGLLLEIFGLTSEGELVSQEHVLQETMLRVRRDLFDDELSTSTKEDSSSPVMNSVSSKYSGKPSSSSEFSKTKPKRRIDRDEQKGTEVGVVEAVIQQNESRKKRSIQGASAERSSPPRNAVLFTYSDDGHNGRKVRDAKTLSRHYRAAQAQNQKRRKLHRNKNRRRNLCARHNMFVDFTDVGWNDWIVAPPGYHAFHCSGECPFPMAENLNATNHAVIQALVNSMNPGLVPPPCCVPTKYSSLSLLYTDSSDKIVLKNYNEMVVDSCGCS